MIIRSTQFGMTKRKEKGRFVQSSVQRRRRAVLLLGLFLSLAWIGAAANPVLAHANLVRSDPQADAVLEASPRELRLWFSEAPELRFSDVQLLDRRRVRVEEQPVGEPVPAVDVLGHRSPSVEPTLGLGIEG